MAGKMLEEVITPIPNLAHEVLPCGTLPGGHMLEGTWVPESPP